MPGKALNFWDDLKSVIKPVSISAFELNRPAPMPKDRSLGPITCI